MNRREFLRHATTAMAASAVTRVAAQRGPEFDYIVVGAGSAGCVAAARLSDDPSVRVLLIEAGGPRSSDPSVMTPGRWVTLIGSPFDWGYASVAEPGAASRRITFPRGKVVGGSSAINAMTYIRGHRADFDRWAAAGNQDWGYADVLPVFKRLETNSRGASEYRGGDGPLAVSDCLDPHAGHEAFLAAAAAAGFEARPGWEFSAPQHENGAGYYQKNIRDGRRHSAADAFLAPIASRTNLQIITGAHATKLLFTGRRATGLEYSLEGQSAQARASREIILCGGVIGSPKLLMLSGIGPAPHLSEHGIPVLVDLPGVGGNLQDHLKLSVRWNGAATLPPSTVTAGMFVRSRVVGGEGPAAPDLQFYVGRGVDQPDRFVTITVSLVRPKSRGDVRLASADPLAAPRIRGNYLSERADLMALLDGIRLARELGQSTAYAKLRADEIEPGPGVSTEAALVEFARRASDTIYHPAGTCRMGGDRLAVVDSRLRVRGVEGLRVADASIMPDVVSATTHAACVMIGARAAEFVRA